MTYPDTVNSGHKCLTYYLENNTTVTLETRYGAILNKLPKSELLTLAEVLEDTLGARLDITPDLLVSDITAFELPEGRQAILDILQIVGDNLADRDRDNRTTLATIARCARRYAEMR